MKYLLALLAAPLLGSAAVAALLPEPQDLVPNVPREFPRLYFASHEHEAKLLGRYLWHHFSTRLGNNHVLFNKEYLTIADLWMAGAMDRQRNKPIQQVHREDILRVQMDDEGYVHTHQHFSHAHEHGWPFPLWTQAGMGPDEVKGVTAGWHFQNDGPGWVWGYLKRWKRPEYYGETATRGWLLRNVRSLGIVDGKWKLEATGPSPSITTPSGIEIDAFNAPFLQLRWTRTGEPPEGRLPYVEWMREGDENFGEDRRVYFTPFTSEEHESVTNCRHSMICMYRHPKWQGKIKRLRICLAPGESDVKFAIDSFFTVYDTRHSINNPIFILACWNYFRWTCDIDFLRRNMNKMRAALRYQQTEMGGLKYNHIRNPWPGHDGLPGWVRNPDGSKTLRPGHGIGNNYWDLLPFGWDDMYATSQYYAATLAMAEAEEAVAAHPEWGISGGALAFDPAQLRSHAAAVKAEANRRFWNHQTGRFVGWIDKEGKAWDYGFTFVNLEAIWYGIASDRHAREIVDWIAGKRIVEGDTSTGADIYHWRFGPRATTKRNIECYGQGWTGPESIPWGGQVQDGGAVLGFTFFDLWARLHVLGPDSAWQRLKEILAWEEEVWKEGGYREYYKDGKRGTTLQGGGTAGGLGIDFEFFESSLLPSIVVYGFMGLKPTPDALVVAPKLPKECPEMGVSGLLYHGVVLDVKASREDVLLEVKSQPVDAIVVVLGEGKGERVRITAPGVYRLTAQGST
ncbi:MAG: hypothetical protein ACUVTZ_06400 [Armatimonadota bacterium]